MDQWDELVRRVAKRVAESGQQPRPCVTVAEAAAIGRWLGVTLHPLLVRLYTEVGNGGFGPGFGLLPLPALEELPLVEEPEESGDDPEPPEGAWPSGIIPILDRGCGMEAGIDCLSDAGTVLLDDPNVDPGERGEGCWFVEASSLEEWLEDWLQGRERAVLERWAEARARLDASWD
jgi:hypothetical protein